MKRFIVFAAVIAIAAAGMAQVNENAVLMTVNGEPSTVGEFLYIYQKNNQEAQVDQRSIDEYLELFTNFKLKVAAAKEAGIDTTAAFKKELEGYRRQATPKYMADSVSEEAVIQKAYGRMLYDRRVRHIAVRCSDNESELAAARLKIDSIRQRVTTGLVVTTGKGKNKKTKQLPVEDFTEVAYAMSDDPNVAETGGLVGFVRPFRFVFQFEEAAYNTAIGEVSEVFQTPFGLHILKVEDEMPHLEVKAAHIMKMTPKGNDSIAAIAKQQIDSLYQLILAGADFTQLATQNSDDRGSAMRGGDLGFFSRGQMVAEFEEVAFGLEPGQVSEPFKSQFGWHIIMRGESRGTADLAEIREEVKKNINRSEYRQLVNKGFVDKLRAEYGVETNDYALSDLADAWIVAAGNDSVFRANTNEKNAQLCVIGGKEYSQQDLIDYISQNPYANSQRLSAFIPEKYDMFVEKELRAMENANLENKYPEFRNLMAEYHDGILLFEVSLREVWDKASQDTTGITKFFEQNKKNYTWDSPRYKGYIVYAKDKKTAKAAQQIIKSANPDSINSYINTRLNTDSVRNVRYERGIWKQGDNKAVDRLVFKDKKNGYTPSEQFPVELVIGKKQKSPEEYTDEKGKVTADYQDYLEKRWIEQLKAKYVVVIDQEVLETLKQ